MAPRPPTPGDDGVPDPSRGRPGVPRTQKKIALDPAESSAIERQ
ncbi:hypothetical protein [Streptomyces sp. C]|nr:hypothetical protein [Streptomyces sp. C]